MDDLLKNFHFDSTIGRWYFKAKTQTSIFIMYFETRGAMQLNEYFIDFFYN